MDSAPPGAAVVVPGVPVGDVPGVPVGDVPGVPVGIPGLGVPVAGVPVGEYGVAVFVAVEVLSCARHVVLAAMPRAPDMMVAHARTLKLEKPTACSDRPRSLHLFRICQGTKYADTISSSLISNRADVFITQFLDAEVIHPSMPIHYTRFPMLLASIWWELANHCQSAISSRVRTRRPGP